MIQNVDTTAAIKFYEGALLSTNASSLEVFWTGSGGRNGTYPLPGFLPPMVNDNFWCRNSEAHEHKRIMEKGRSVDMKHHDERFVDGVEIIQ